MEMSEGKVKVCTDVAMIGERLCSLASTPVTVKFIRIRPSVATMPAGQNLEGQWFDKVISEEMIEQACMKHLLVLPLNAMKE